MGKRAIGAYVLIRKTLGETRQRKSGLIDTASNTEDRWVKAEIISVGDVAKSEFGLGSGQVILYDKHAGQPVTVNGEKLHIIMANSVALVL